MSLEPAYRDDIEGGRRGLGVKMIGDAARGKASSPGKKLNFVGDESLTGNKCPFLSPRPDRGVGTRSGSRRAKGVVGVGMRIGCAGSEGIKLVPLSSSGWVFCSSNSLPVLSRDVASAPCGSILCGRDGWSASDWKGWGSATRSVGRRFDRQQSKRPCLG